MWILNRIWKRGGVLKKKKKSQVTRQTFCLSHSKQTDWTSFILLPVGGLLLLSQLNPAFFLLSGCRLVPSYSDRVRMYQMGSFKAGSARLQTWKRRDPAASRGLALGASWKTFPSFPFKEKFTAQAQSVFGNITTQRLLRPCWEQCCGGWNRHPMVGQPASVNDADDVSVADSPELAHRRPACPLNLLIRHLDKNISSLINLSARDTWQSLWFNFKCGFFFFLEIGKTSIGRWTWSRRRWKCEICLCVIPPRDGCLISMIKSHTSQ